MRLRVLDEARQELVAAVRYYRTEVDDQDLARDMVEKLRDRIQYLRRVPFGGALVTGYDTTYEVRRFALKRFPYVLSVARTDDEQVIVAMAHNRQKPGYWRDRLTDVESDG